MKKQVKKLALAKETLVNLEESLGQVAGGVTLKACTFSGYNTCQTCGASCGTNLC
jgi:hypothetical protein